RRQWAGTWPARSEASSQPSSWPRGSPGAMCPTIYGRVQTRWAILIMPAIIATIISLITQNPGSIILIGIYFVIGVGLDLLFYPFIIRWQPPWLTFTLAAGEFVIVYLIGKVLHVSLTPLEAILLYWLAWWMA